MSGVLPIIAHVGRSASPGGRGWPVAFEKDVTFGFVRRYRFLAYVSPLERGSMATMVNELLGRPAAGSLSGTQVACLARTFRRTNAAVWIDDVTGRCVYRNADVGRDAAFTRGSARFDIRDHTGRVVARMYLDGR